jgi:uncharacterized membrane protein
MLRRLAAGQVVWLMTLTPILDADPIIQVHLIAALGALLLGVVQLSGAKGTVAHRRLGWIWVAMMAVVAVSSFWIQDLFDGFGPIHGLAVMVLVFLPAGIGRARRGEINSHAATMKGLFLGALILAGVFTLLPGRILGRALLGW